MDSQTHADVVVVGGGIIGLATAYETAKRGARVVLIEKDELGCEQSNRNWGYTRQQGRHRAELPLALAAIAKWPKLADELGEETEWVESGSLMIAPTEKALADYRTWTVLGNAAGVPTQVLSGDQIAGVAPFLTGDWPGAMYTPNDGHANPARVCAAYGAAARRVGCDVRSRCTAVRLIPTMGAVVGVETSDGLVFGNRVVVAAGTWSRRLLSTAAVRIPTQWVRSSVAATTPTRRVEGSLPVWAPGCAFRQALDGSVVFAPAGSSDVDVMLSAAHDLRCFVPLWAKNIDMGFRLRVGKPLLEDLRRGRAATGCYARSEPPVNRSRIGLAHARLGELVRHWRDASVARTWAGYIDGTPDSLPIIDTVAELSGLIVATGFSGHGFGIGPAVGEVLASVVLDDEQPDTLRPFRIDRFAQARPVGVQKIH